MDGHTDWRLPNNKEMAYVKGRGRGREREGEVGGEGWRGEERRGEGKGKKREEALDCFVLTHFFSLLFLLSCLFVCLFICLFYVYFILLSFVILLSSFQFLHG